MASQSTLYTPGTAPSGTSKLVYLAIVNLLKDACAELNMTYEDSVYEKVALDLMALVDMDKPGPRYGASFAANSTYRYTIFAARRRPVSLGRERLHHADQMEPDRQCFVGNRPERDAACPWAWRGTYPRS